jgi:hypothetical protein
MILIGMIAVSSLRSTPAVATVVRIDAQPDGSLRVELLDADANPATIERDLREAGIASTVRRAATGPSRVGTIISVVIPATVGATVDLATREFILPPRVSGTITLTVGVAAKPGQRYDQPSSAFAPGEPLAGFAEPTDATAVAAAAKAAGLTVWLLGEAGDKLEAVPPGGRVTGPVAMRSSTEIQIRIAD